jgi:hypothetical protein
MLYACIAGLLLAVFKRWYDNIVIRDQAIARAKEMTLAADNAMDELQDELETQDQIFSSFNARNKDIIRLVDQLPDAETHSVSAPSFSSSPEVTEAVTAGDALCILENSLVAFENGLQFDINAYSNELMSTYLARSPEQRSRIITIIDVTEFTFPAPTASRLALLVYVFVDHAFARISESTSAAPILSIQLTSPLISDTKTVGWVLNMSIEAGSEDCSRSSNGDASDLGQALQPLCEDLDTSPVIRSDQSGCQVTIEFDNRFAH